MSLKPRKSLFVLSTNRYFFEKIKSKGSFYILTVGRWLLIFILMQTHIPNEPIWPCVDDP